MKKKLAIVIGARPQFIKHAPVENALKKYFDTFSIHTGQHYDQKMSDIFFDQLGMNEPTYMLSVGSASHGKQTGIMIQKIEEALLKEKPATAESASKAVSDFGDKIKKQAADTKGKKTAKDAGKVDKSSREGSNKQERQKRRAERKSIRKDKTLSSSQKKIAKKESRQKQKENVRGVKK